jgi:hypothetical protein
VATLKRYVERVETEVRLNVLTEVKCDICGQAPVEINESSNWSAFCNQHITIRNVTYSVDDVDEEEFDCCPECWDKHIKPLFKKS